MFPNYLLAFLVFISSALALHLPSYIVPCSKSHNFNECALDHAKKALPYLLKGDKRYKIPSLSPFRIAHIDLKGNTNFQLRIKDVEVHGLETAVPVKMNIDFDRRRAYSVFTASRVTILGDYEMKGKLIFPINGQGKCNVTLCGGIYKLMFEWTLEEKDGDVYARIVKPVYQYDLEDVKINFENLFNGDKELSDKLNAVLNENWRILNQDLEDAIKEALFVIQNGILEKFYTTIPYKELFLD